MKKNSVVEEGIVSKSKESNKEINNLSNGNRPLEEFTNQAQQSMGSDAETSTSALEAEVPHNSLSSTPTTQLGGEFTIQGEGDANRDDINTGKKDADKESGNDDPKLTQFSPIPEHSHDSEANEMSSVDEIDKNSDKKNADNESGNDNPILPQFPPLPDGNPELFNHFNIAEHPNEDPLCQPSLAALLGVMAVGLAFYFSNMQ